MIQTVPNTAAANSLAVPIEQLFTRSQIRTRKGFEEESLKELAASIARLGILQPLIVTPVADGPGYWVVAGERRLLAASMAGVTELPCVVRCDDAADLVAVQAVENLQRENLSLADMAYGLDALKRLHGSWGAVAKAIGKSPAWVSKRRALTRLRRISRAVMNEGLSNDPEVLLSLNTLEKTQPELVAKIADSATLDGKKLDRALIREMVAAEKERQAFEQKQAAKRAKATESGQRDAEKGEARDGENDPDPTATRPVTARGVTLKLNATRALWLRRVLSELPASGPRNDMLATLNEWWAEVSKP